jgi:hypothetical protein
VIVRRDKLVRNPVDRLWHRLLGGSWRGGV